MADYILSDHARKEMALRHISEESVLRVLDAPDQVFEQRPGRMVYQSILESAHAERRYLLRIFVDIDRIPMVVVSAYVTSRLARYWRNDS